MRRGYNQLSIMFESSFLIRNEVYTAWKSKDRRKAKNRKPENPIWK